MAYVIKRTGQFEYVSQTETGTQVGCEAFDETLVDGIPDLDEACIVLLEHRDHQRQGSDGYTEVSVVSHHGETVAWLDENLNVVKRQSAEIIPFR